jgi:hypothetical protein
MAHRTHGEEQCCECFEAWRLYQKQYRANNSLYRICVVCNDLFVKAGKSNQCADCLSKVPTCLDCKNRHAKQGSRFCDDCSAVRKKLRIRKKTFKQRWASSGMTFEHYMRRFSDDWRSVPGPWLEDLEPLHGPNVPELTACIFCGTKQNRKWCSLLCYRLGTGRQPTVSKIIYLNCESCCNLFVASSKRQRKRYCSALCSRRENNRKKARRRRIRRFDVEQEPYTLRQIAERDGWRCHICLRKVPDRPYRARPNDATIDHLVPVSANGADTPQNVALAHNACNIKRSNRGPAQLRLIG